MSPCEKEVEWLLAQADVTSNFLEAPALEIAAKALADDQAGMADVANQSGPTPGCMISHYRMLQKVGSGGMGEVWLAEQKQPVRRRVALKLIKAGMDTREVVARFESERQALALMNHPGIAKVFDGGSTEQGRPYFVMEYVAGIPATIYCDKHRLSIRERLRVVHPRVRSRTARPSEGYHSSRPEALQHLGDGSGWRAMAEDH